MPTTWNLQPDTPLRTDTADTLRAGMLTGADAHIPSCLTGEVPDASFEEGRRLLLIHIRRERAQGLVKAKLESVSHPQCEVCGFSFEQCYGEIGAGFAEIHHRTPLHKSDDVRLTKLEDLAIVCANCHCMLHRKPFPSLERLRGSLQAQNNCQEPG